MVYTSLHAGLSSVVSLVVLVGHIIGSPPALGGMGGYGIEAPVGDADFSQF